MNKVKKKMKEKNKKFKKALIATTAATSILVNQGYDSPFEIIDDTDSEDSISQYEEKKKINYEKTVQRIEKDFNKKVYNYEIQCKKEIIDEQRKLKENLKNEIRTKLAKFVEKDEYKDILIKSIDERINKN